MRIPRLVAATLLGLGLLVLCACAGELGLAHGDPGRSPTEGVPTRTPIPPPTTTPVAAQAAPSAPPASITAISAVVVTFTDHARQLAAADPRLTPDEIGLAVETELQAQGLFAPAAPGVHRTLAISVEDFTDALASNATVLGYTFRNLVLIGAVQVQGESAGGRGPFTVHARARVGHREAGGSGSLAGLYRRFAALTVADLRGVEAPEEPLPR